MNNLIVTMEENEKWWGGFVSEGTKMPFGQDTEFSIDLYNHNSHNQVASLLLSNKGRVIYCKNGFTVKFNKGEMTIISYDEIIFENVQGDLQSAYLLSKKHTEETAKVLDDAFFKEPQFNSWIELMYDQTEDSIISYARSILENGYKAGILMIDDNWQEDYGVWEFSAKRFINPKKMIETLTSMGFDVMLWVCPFVSPDSQTFRYLEDNNMLVKNKNNEVAIKKWWNGYSGLLDLTNPKTYKWFKEKLDFLVNEIGVKGFKFDAGDIWNYSTDDIIHTPMTALEQVKLYSKFASEYPYNELRTGFNTAEYCLMQRLCDKTHTWDETGIKGLIPNGLVQGLLGYNYCCPDMIGGGEYKNFLPENLKLDQELVVRYAQIAALFPIMQFSASPWKILSSENKDICLSAAKVHSKFSDYIIEQTKKDLPIMRHMAMMYPTLGYDTVSEQFMIGDNLLVAPATNKGQRKKEVYIPNGTWLSDLGETYTGPCVAAIDVPLERLPYFVKK